MRALILTALLLASPALAVEPNSGDQMPTLAGDVTTDRAPAAAAEPPPPPPPPTQACKPAVMTTGQWWRDYTVSTADGRDTYRGMAIDCTAFAVSVPAGTPACKAMNTACPVAGPDPRTAAAMQALVAAGLLTAEQAAKALGQ